MDHNEYMTKNGKLRLINHRVLVKTDPAQDRSSSGLIHFPDGAMEHTLKTGTIVAFGFMREGFEQKPVTKNVPIPGLEVGMKCAFVRFLEKHHSNVQLQEMLDEDLMIVQPSDLLLVFTPDEMDRILR